MSSRHHIDDFMRGRIIGKIEEGRKITDVAREFDIAHRVISRLWKSFKTTGMCSRRHGGGRVRRKQISRKTVARRLKVGGLHARRPVVCVPLTRQQRTARLQLCREYHNWTEQDWACVLFSNESRFSLSSDCRRQLIWRESGTAYRPENIQEKDRYPTCSNMVWAGIVIKGRTRLHVVANGTMRGLRYIDEVLPLVRLFRGAIGDKFVFIDNATCHRAIAVQDCLDGEGIQRLVRPARSPDLNPIENVPDALGRQVSGRNYPPTNKNTLIHALTEEWDKLPQQLLDNVVQKQQITALERLGVTTDKRACLLYPLVKSCMPEDLLRAFQRGLNFYSGDDSKMRLDALLKFLNTEVESEERINLAMTGLNLTDATSCKRESQLKKDKIFTSVSLLTSSVGAEKLCAFCSRQHEPTNCFKAQKVSYRENKKQERDIKLGKVVLIESEIM
ncbi:transposable element Tcb2 transposase [Trichonephila clavipes]|uniref:Transposable element Tcb2 transposase n=1 Tax=Trichonephila clavipes TaxID=2585209 RepID=A0A8X6SW60_TRICX|nr:transposable element Tcb2 transposase [Trichonephila clavipes]